MPTNTKRTRMLITMIAFAATTGIASTAQAGDGASPRYDSVVVNYSDLDLNTAAGTRALYARLSAAAESACGNAPNARDLQRQAQFRACYDSTLNRAIDKVGDRELQALHASGVAHGVG